MAFTLLLRFAGVLQSWGTDSRFEIRRTEMIPTKSGIVGFLAAALGRSRDEEINDLANLKIGVRADQPGTVISDFHTARKDEKTSYVTNRYYLSDAAFLIGIESDSEQQLKELADAVRSPAFPLYLGRRSCVPEIPIVKEILSMPLEDALETYPYIGSQKHEPEIFHIYLEGNSNGIVRKLLDQPVTFDFHHRKYEERQISEIVISNKNKEAEEAAQYYQTEHDILAALEGL